MTTGKNLKEREASIDDDDDDDSPGGRHDARPMALLLQLVIIIGIVIVFFFTTGAIRLDDSPRTAWPTPRDLVGGDERRRWREK